MKPQDDYIPVIATSELGEGEVRRLYVPEIGPIALYCVGGEYYASDDLCTHGHSSLSEEGALEGHFIYCGWHGGSFDIRSGEPMEPPCVDPLKTYPVQVRDGKIHVSRKNKNAS